MWYIFPCQIFHLHTIFITIFLKVLNKANFREHTALNYFLLKYSRLQNSWSYSLLIIVHLIGGSKPAGSVFSFNIHHGLNCKHVVSTPTLTMWLLCSNCAFLNPLRFWVYSQREILCNTSSALSWTQSHLLIFLAKCVNKLMCKKCLRPLAEYLAVLTSLCCPDIFDSRHFSKHFSTTCKWQ